MNRIIATRARRGHDLACHALPLLSLLLLLAPARTARALALPAPMVGAAAAATEERSEYGVSLAMQGEAARAESVFVSLLSNSRGDARALNNLGNLRLLKGETEGYLGPSSGGGSAVRQCRPEIRMWSASNPWSASNSI